MQIKQALAMPAVQLMHKAQAGMTRFHLFQAAYFKQPESFALEAICEEVDLAACAQYNAWRARSLLQLTRAANDELAAPVQA